MNRRNLIKSTAAFLPLALAGEALAASAPNPPAPDPLGPDTVYELRIYHLNPGKLPLILERFRSKETKIFTRLGMHNVAFWSPVDGVLPAETLVYMLRHKSREAARASWAAFKIDPEWVALKAESEKDGTFVAKSESTFLKLTDFSPQI
jgi:hypothetical protein